MSVRKIDLKKTFCPIWTYEASSADSKARATLEYVDDFSGWGPRAPDVGTPHPDLAGMSLVRIRGTREEGNQIRVTLEYESFSIEANYPGRPSKEESVRRYDFEIPTREEHILTHERYNDLSATERQALLDLSNGQKFDEEGNPNQEAVTSDLGQNALAKIRKGITHYLVPTFVWIERFTTKDLADIEMGKSGEIMDPPGPHPNPGSERDFVYLGSTGRNSDDGTAWEVERRWQLSDKGKSDDIYDPDWTP